MGEGRPKIPEPLQRAVRQHCGFGCAVCGSIPTTIEHIIPWSECKEHRFENLVLLCPNHQQDSSAGSLSLGFLMSCRENPFSRKNNSARYDFNLEPVGHVMVAGHMIIVRQDMTIDLVRLNSMRLFSIEIIDGVPYYSISLRDFSGHPTFSMSRNRICLASNRLWDASKRGPYFRVLFGSCRSVVCIKIAQSTLEVRHVRMAEFGYAVEITENRLEVLAKPGLPPGSMAGMLEVPGIPHFSLLSLGYDDDFSKFRLGQPGEVTRNDADKWLWGNRRRVG